MKGWKIHLPIFVALLLTATASAPASALEYVNLFGSRSSGSSSIALNRINPDGSMTAFTIPAGKILIVRRVGWIIYANASDAGKRVTFFLQGPANGAVRNFYAYSARIADDGVSGGADNLTLGFPSTKTLSGMVLYDRSWSPVSGEVYVRVHAILTDEKEIASLPFLGLLLLE